MNLTSEHWNAKGLSTTELMRLVEIGNGANGTEEFLVDMIKKLFHTISVIGEEFDHLRRVIDRVGQ
jgi:hypothetical protein